MAAPTNEMLVKICSEVESKITSETDVYTLTSTYVVKKGTNLEELLSDLVQGKYQPPNHDDLTVGMCFKDITKVS